MLAKIKAALHPLTWRDWIVLLIFGMQIVTLSAVFDARNSADSAAYAGWDASSDVDRVADACERASEAAGDAREFAEEARDKASQASYQCQEQ